jgi:hypothetical protein
MQHKPVQQPIVRKAIAGGKPVENSVGANLEQAPPLSYFFRTALRNVSNGWFRMGKSIQLYALTHFQDVVDTRPRLIPAWYEKVHSVGQL